jgi:hypothetical protein
LKNNLLQLGYKVSNRLKCLILRESEGGCMPGKRMTRLAETEALRRYENSARTAGEFRELCELYDKLDGNRERRERGHEIGTSEYKLLNTTIVKSSKGIDPELREAERENGYSDGAVIPPPLVMEYWQELMRGDFISTIYDSADEVWQIVGDWQVGQLIRDLTAKQRDALFRNAVRLCSSEQIAIQCQQVKQPRKTVTQM